MTKPKLPDAIKTIEISNFGGQLTRTINGDLNSGLAKFTTSFGYDFFTKPGNLTWLENPSDITGPIHGLPLASKNRYLGENNPSVYLITSSGNIYQIYVTNINSGGTNPILNSVVGIGSVLSGNATYTYGASMEFFQASMTSSVFGERIYIGSDNQVNWIKTDFTADAVVGVTADYTPSKYHPLKKFIGKLLVGDGQAVDYIDNTNLVTSSAFGALPTETRVRDIDISPDGNYAMVSTTTNDYEPVSDVSESRIIGSIPSDGTVFYWNGADLAPTALNNLPGSQITALQVYLQNSISFITDSMGSALSDGTNKILSLPNNKAPFPNATGTNGNYLFWSTIEYALSNPNVPTSGALQAVMYYYGSTDGTTPPGLYRMFRQTGSAGNVIQSPMNTLVSTAYSDLDATRSSVVSKGYGQHYYSTFDTNTVSSVTALKSFCFPPSGLQSPQFGFYETQTQLFSEKITVKQIRVYTEPTVAGNEFSIYFIGSDGLVIDSQTYFFQAGTDITKLQGSLDRVDFTPTFSTYALGLRIAQQGSTNMTIKKIEVDYTQSGK